MSDLISRKTALERAEGCTFTDKNEKRKFMDWLNYCLEAPIEPQWIPCSEMSPDNDTDVLICSGEFVHEAHFNDGHFSDTYGMWYKSVTHWMPLPEPYKAEQT